MVWVGTGALPSAPSDRHVTVRGHDARVGVLVCASLPSGCTQVSVSWAEDADHWVTVAYSGPGQDAVGGPPLSMDEVVQAAQSFVLGTSGWPTRTLAPQPVGPLPSSTRGAAAT